MTNIDRNEVDVLIQITGLYDGWSVAKMKDGTYVNRWPEGDARHAEVDKLVTERNALGVTR